MELFRPYFERLIEVLISKGQLPENENIFTNEDKESFRCYRVDITDTMVKLDDVCFASFFISMDCLDVHAQCSIDSRSGR